MTKKERIPDYFVRFSYDYESKLDNVWFPIYVLKDRFLELKAVPWFKDKLPYCHLSEYEDWYCENEMNLVRKIIYYHSPYILQVTVIPGGDLETSRMLYE